MVKLGISCLSQVRIRRILIHADMILCEIYNYIERERLREREREIKKTIKIDRN